MSMLTPPGMSGRQNRITGERYPRMRPPRRRRRLGFAAVASLGVLGLLGYGTVQLIDVFSGEKNPEAGQAAAASASQPDRSQDECEPGDARPVPLPEPDTVTVNVYNTTDRSGLAQQTADALEERGFVIGEVDNVPEELEDREPVTGLALGSEAAADAGALTLLGSHIAGTGGDPETGPVDRDDSEVDLLLGEEFGELAEEEEVGAALTALREAPEPEPDDECAGPENGRGE